MVNNIFICKFRNQIHRLQHTQNSDPKLKEDKAEPERQAQKTSIIVYIWCMCV